MIWEGAGERSPSRREIRKRSLGTQACESTQDTLASWGPPRDSEINRQDPTVWGRGEKCGATGVAAVGKLKGRCKLHQRMNRVSTEVPSLWGEGMSILAAGLGGESVQV